MARTWTIGLLFVISVFLCSWITQTRFLPRLHLGGQARRVTSSATSELFVAAHAKCAKHIHIFGDLTEMKKWPALSLWYERFKTSQALGHAFDSLCPHHHCTLRFTLGTNTSHFRGKDAVIFGPLPTAFRGRLLQLLSIQPELNQTWIYYSTEPPMRVLRWLRDLKVAELKYHKLMTYRLDSDIPIPFGEYRERTRALTDDVFLRTYDPRNKTKLLAWMASNCVEISWPRLPLMERIGQQLPLDTFGRCGNRTCLPQQSRRCNDMLRQYKFYMALANSECREYITEKFWDKSLGQGIVPVVYGAPKEDFERLGPPNSFIHLSDFSSVNELARHLELLAEDHDSYMKYFRWAQKYEAISMFPLNVTDLCKIIPHLYNGTAQNLHNLGNSTWYRGCRKPDTNIMTPIWSKKKQDTAYSTWSPWGSARDGKEQHPGNLRTSF